ncbi:hypothetical protein ACWIGW_45795 [Nocardia brasiliensis]
MANPSGRAGHLIKYKVEWRVSYMADQHLDTTVRVGWNSDGRLAAGHGLPYRTRIVHPGELEYLCRINYELFSGGTFSASLQKVRERNVDILRVNRLSFAIVEAEVRGEFVPIGMSSMLPLNRYGEAQYCRTGGLRDIDLRGRHIAAPDEWSDAVLIFIIGLTRAARGRLRDRPLTAIANIVFDHGAHLISSMHARHPGNRQLRLLAQTDRSNGGMNRLFQFGGSSTGITTGDGYPLYELIVKLPATLPDRKDLSGSFLSMFERITKARSSVDVKTCSAVLKQPE